MKKKEQKLTYYVCSKCGCHDVQIRTWIEVNTDIVIDKPNEFEMVDTWCPDCEEHTGLELKEAEDDTE